MADKAPITPRVVKWARESAKMRVDEAAKKLSVPDEKLKEWESGADQPSIAQAQNLAKLYKRPFALFFLSEIPTDFQPLQDYRKNAAELSTASAFIIREIQQKQAWISELYQENGEEVLSFVGKFSLRTATDIVAADILRTLNINPPNYKTDNPVKEWVDKAEAVGIFVSRSSFIHTRMKFNSDEMKGFAIVDRYAPFVFVNTEDWKAPQLFTLVHELAHIWIGESGISNDSDFQRKLRSQTHQVEAFCNEVAAIALMPDMVMKKLPRYSFRSADELFKVAKVWGVSTFAILVRALNMNLISLSEYNALKAEADYAFSLYVKREEVRRESERDKEKNGPSPYVLRLNRNSRLFTQAVLDAFRSGIIPPTQASSLLNVKTNNFSKLEKILYPPA